MKSATLIDRQTTDSPDIFRSDLTTRNVGLRRPWFSFALCPRTAPLIFAGIAALIYVPFLLYGQVLVSTTDSVYTHYPNLVFGHRALRSGDLGLWNPYVFAGMDFTATQHHAMLNPAYWWLALLPERYLFHGLTAQFLIETALIGIVAFAIFRAVLPNRTVAFAMAVATQSSGFVWFTTSTFIATVMLLEALVAVYLLVTYRRRSFLLNYAFLSLCLGMLLLAGHVAYIPAFGLPVALVAVGVMLRARTTGDSRRLFLTVATAFLTASIIAAVRLASVLQALSSEQGGVIENAWLKVPSNTASYLFASGFIPGIWGHDFATTSQVLYYMHSFGRNGQFHNMLYFGVPALAVIFMALRGALGRSAAVGAWFFAVFAITAVTASQFVADVLSFIAWPAIHDIIWRVMSMAMAAFTAAAGLRHLCRRRLVATPDLGVRFFLTFCGLIVAVGLTGLARVVHEAAYSGWILQLLRIAVVGVVGASIWIAVRMREDLETVRSLSTAVAVAAWIGVVIVLAVSTWLQVWDERMMVYGTLYAVAGIGWATVTLTLSRSMHLWTQRRSGFAVAYALLLLPLLMNPAGGGSQGWATLATASTLDILKFLLIAAVTVEIVVSALVVGRNRLVFLLLWTTLLAGDLIFFTKNYGFSGASPFQAVDVMYPGYGKEQDRVAGAVLSTRPRPNLLADPVFERVGRVDGWSVGGKAPGFAVRQDDKGEIIVKLTNKADDWATLFQDLNAGPDLRRMGVWVRATSPTQAGVDLGGKAFHSGSGKWEYLRSSLNGNSLSRPTLFINGPGEAEFAIPELAEGNGTLPARAPAGEAAPLGVSNGLDHGAVGTIDLQRYRVNQPWLYSHHPYGPVMSNLEVLYGVPTYGGVDSAVNASLMNFLAACQPPDENWFGRGGIKPLLTNERCLDLLGVKYDFERGQMFERNNAIARLSLFRDFEVIQSKEATLKRLTSGDVDSTRMVMLSENPGLEPQHAGAARFTAPNFISTTTSHLTVGVNDARPAILLFNDLFSDGWQATVDGRPAKILRANTAFMAVPLPSGAKVVSLDFRPWLFLTLGKISLGVASAVLLLAVSLALAQHVFKRV